MENKQLFSIKDHLTSKGWSLNVSSEDGEIWHIYGWKIPSGYLNDEIEIEQTNDSSGNPEEIGKIVVRYSNRQKEFEPVTSIDDLEQILEFIETVIMPFATQCEPEQ